MHHKVLMVLVATLTVLTIAGYIGASPEASETTHPVQNAQANHHPVRASE